MSNMLSHSLRGIALLGMLTAFAVGCLAPLAWGKGPQAYPYRITTTVGMVTDIVKQVAGDKATVTGIIGEGIDPHLYKVTRDDVVALIQADVIFYAGLMLEGKMGDVLAKIARRRPVYAVTERLAEEYLLRPEEMEGHYDPHVWMDPAAWAKAVEVVADALCDFDPQNAPSYRANADALIQQMRALHDYGKKVMATIPPNSRILITSHDAFNYFGRAYGLKVLGVQGLSTESEAGLQDLNSLVDLIVSNDIKAVFIETSVPQKNIRALIDGARARGKIVRIGGELFSDAMGPPGTYEGTYIGMLDHNITTVVRALGGEAPERGMQGKLTHP